MLKEKQQNIKFIQNYKCAQTAENQKQKNYQNFRLTKHEK